MPQIIPCPLTISADEQERIRELLTAATRLEGTYMATLQFYDERTESLYLVAQKGFSKKFVDYFRTVKAFDPSSCGRAFGIGSPIIINDTREDLAFHSMKDVIENEGILAVKSVPIFTADRKKLGVISTHFSEPKFNWNLHLLGNVIKEISEILFALKLKDDSRFQTA